MSQVKGENRIGDSGVKSYDSLPAPQRAALKEFFMRGYEQGWAERDGKDPNYDPDRSFFIMLQFMQ